MTMASYILPLTHGRTPATGILLAEVMKNTGRNKPPTEEPLRNRTCVVAARPLHDELVSARQLGGGVHVLVGGLLTAVLDVLPHRAGKQHTVLAHHSDL